MRATIPQYAAIPGLSFKAYTLTDARRFGGIYLWTDRAAAERWFSAEWHARVRHERGVDGEVRLLEAPVTFDRIAGGPPAAEKTRGLVATVALWPAPVGATPAALHARFAAERETLAAGGDSAAPGLLRRHWVHDPATGRIGIVSFWRSRDASLAGHDAAWHARLRTETGADQYVEWYDVPIVVHGAGTTPPVAPR